MVYISFSNFYEVKRILCLSISNKINAKNQN